MKLVMYLMNKKGYKVLENFLKLYKANSIEYVITASDNNLENDYYEDIVKICEKNKILCYERKDHIPKFEGYKIAIGWRWLVPESKNLIIMHDSILPKYRGFAPLVNMLINGEKEIGVSAIFASENYDEGKIIQQKKRKITYPLKIDEAINQISIIYCELVVDLYEKLLNQKELQGYSQDDNQATYSLWRDEKDYYIDWSSSAGVIRRTVDALGYPYDGAKTSVNGKFAKLISVEEVEDVEIENRQPGKVIFNFSGEPVVVCGEGLIRIKEVYDENGNNMLPLRKFRSRFGGIEIDNF